MKIVVVGSATLPYCRALQMHDSNMLSKSDGHIVMRPGIMLSRACLVSNPTVVFSGLTRILNTTTLGRLLGCKWQTLLCTGLC